MGIQLSESALRLVDGKNYAVLATVNPDGSPQTSVVWVGRDGGDLLFSTVEGRVKHRNMMRDPRVSVSIIDSADPENYVELRGRVSMTPDVGRAVDTQLSWKYDGRDPGEEAQDVAVLNHHPFGAAGRARGVDDVREVVPLGTTLEVGCVVVSHGRGVEADCGGSRGRQAVAEGLLRKHQR